MSAVVPAGPTPIRAIWQREPVRVISAVMTLLAGLNALFLGLNAYDGGAAAAITGFIAVLGVVANELFTRAEVVPIKPLEDLAERAQARLDER
jgi:hypothetical protein